METVVLACDTLRRELEAAMTHTGRNLSIVWLPGGNHNVPNARRTQIQAALAEIPENCTVLMAMTLCGGSLEGLETGRRQLVVPRCDDCVTLVLGQSLREHNPYTYFLTEGWLRGARSLETEYRHCVDRHGQERARRIFSRMLAHYRYLALVDLGIPAPETEIRVLELARTLGLEYRHLEGNTHWLEELLTGPWVPERFLILPPHTGNESRETGGCHDP